MAKPTGLGTSWLWPHRQYCGHWRFRLCRMAFSLSDCFIACNVFQACGHDGVACCLLFGVVHELSAPCGLWSGVLSPVAVFQPAIIRLLL